MTAALPAHPRRRRAPRLAALAAAVALTAGLAACGDDSGEPAAAGTGSASASSTAPALSAEDLAHGNQTSAVDVDVKGPLQVDYRRITFPPGTGTGKHCHQGNLIAVVEKGTLTHYAPIYPDGVHEYKAGDSLTEGSGYVHEGKNEGTEDVVLLVTYITPKGDPLAVTDLDECDTKQS